MLTVFDELHPFAGYFLITVAGSVCRIILIPFFKSEVVQHMALMILRSLAFGCFGGLLVYHYATASGWTPGYIFAACGLAGLFSGDLVFELLKVLPSAAIIIRDAWVQKLTPKGKDDNDLLP